MKIVLYSCYSGILVACEGGSPRKREFCLTYLPYPSSSWQFAFNTILRCVVFLCPQFHNSRVVTDRRRFMWCNAPRTLDFLQNIAENTFCLQLHKTKTNILYFLSKPKQNIRLNNATGAVFVTTAWSDEKPHRNKAASFINSGRVHYEIRVTFLL